MNHELNIELEIEKEEEKKRLPLPPAFPQCTSDCCCLGFRSSSQYRCFLWFSSWPHKGGSAECKGVLQCGGVAAQSALHPRRGRLAMMTTIIRRLWKRTRGGENGLWSFSDSFKTSLEVMMGKKLNTIHSIWKSIETGEMICAQNWFLFRCQRFAVTSPIHGYWRWGSKYQTSWPCQS